MISRECAWNADIGSRIESRKDWFLYLNECYWVLDIENNFEFYFNPTHFIGKLSKKDLPQIVVERIKSESLCFDYEKLKSGEKTKLVNSHVDMVRLDNEMRIGNWFYAQGYNYVTYKGKFIRRIDPYGGQEECYFRSIKADIVRDMLRMTASTKSHYYVKNLFELNCFSGINADCTIIKPLDDFFWNSDLWKNRYEDISKKLKSYPKNNSYKFEMRTMRKDVFMHTLFVIKEGGYHTVDGKSVSLPDCKNVMYNSKYYYVKQNIVREVDYETIITVENTDCLVAAKKMLSDSYNPAVLNMANRQNPGGGVYNGAGAQEENLFRRTNLFQSLYQFSDLAGLYKLTRSRYSYPLDRNYGGIYSPEVVVFRGEEKDGYPLLDDYYQVAIISVAGMNRPELDSQGRIAAHLVEGVKNKIRTIFNIALENGHDSLVLGALGCGAFRNPPAHIAKLFHEVIESEYKNKFKKICFAILEDHNSIRKDSGKGNFMPFYEEFCKLN